MILVHGLMLLGLVSSGTCAMLVTRMRVKGPSYSQYAKMPSDCLTLCKSLSDCDSANYEIATRKCRIFGRCTPSLLAYNSTGHIHFSKRPPLQEAGYHYHEESDSCIKLVEELMEYPSAEAWCNERSGRLLAITDASVNSLAASLVAGGGTQYAWIGAFDCYQEGNPILTNGQRVSKTGWFPTGRQEAREDPTRNCWSISDEGTWAEHRCKERRQYSLCQIMPNKSC